MAGDRVDYAPGYVFLPRSAYQDDNTATLAAQASTSRNASPSSPTLGDARARAAAGRGRAAPGPRPAVRAGANADPGGGVDGGGGGDDRGVRRPPARLRAGANDRDTLALPGDQVELLIRLADVRDRTARGSSRALPRSAVTMDPWHDRVDAILDTWLGARHSAEPSPTCCSAVSIPPEERRFVPTRPRGYARTAPLAR